MVNRLEAAHGRGGQIEPSLEMVWSVFSTLSACVHKVMKVANDNMARVRQEHDESHRILEKQKLKLPKGVLCHSSILPQTVGSAPSLFMLRV